MTPKETTSSSPVQPSSDLMAVLKKNKLILGVLGGSVLIVLLITLILLISNYFTKTVTTPVNVTPTQSLLDNLKNLITSTPVQNQVAAFVSLKPEPNVSDVGSVKNCDLSIKFPQKVNGKNVYTGYVYVPKLKSKADVQKDYNTKYKDYTGNDKPSFDTFYNNYVKDMTIVDSKTIAAVEVSIKTTGTNLPSGVSCHDKTVLQSELLKDGLILKYKLSHTVINKQLTKDELNELTGWYVTQSDLESIILNTYINNSSGIVYNYINFNYNDKLYLVKYSDKTSRVTGVPGDSIQMQFDTVAKNEDNIEIKDKINTYTDCVAAGFPSIFVSGKNVCTTDYGVEFTK